MLGNRVQNYSKEDLKEVQSALNFFGFKAGNADGVLGRKTKRAIAQYNVCLDIGEYVDLTEKARNLLVKTYQKYKTVSSLGRGCRDLLTEAPLSLMPSLIFIDFKPSYSLKKIDL